ncbi:Protein TolB [termite gut metagenome]|uniref:Protein TolB n=1 Tax=termite gut metagenome TaxID=433724 RepID=A0A5J4S1B7_9ZZZZ
MKSFFLHILCLGFFLPFFSCKEQLPENAVSIELPVTITPDYSNLMIPYNIAPLNFTIDEEAEEYRTRVFSGSGKEFLVSGKKVRMDEDDWGELLRENKGDSLVMEIYVKKGNKWFTYPPVKNGIAEDKIDEYISYRLIEPSYVTYEEMSINQRNLTTFKEKVIYDNFLLSTKNKGQCINCHSFQNYNKTGNMQFHVRQELRGTVIVRNNKAEKVNLKTDYTLSSGVYPSWHPSEMLIAYSVNNTSQNFHTKDVQKVEVLDSESDIILYDILKNEVIKVADGKNEFETFPSWSADGKYLYYVSAPYESEMDNEYDRYIELANRYQTIKYTIFRKPFDIRTRRFGTADTVFQSSAWEKSATLPRESPDGNYVLFTLGDFGNFHVWHTSSDLYVINLQTKEVRELAVLNSPDAESYHSWSSNGRWILFGSRRDDGSYTRPYMAYFDKDGQAHKPFILPQKDPDFYKRFFKSYNVLEFMTEPVKVSRNSFVKAIKKEPKQAMFHGNEEKNDTVQEGNTTANFYE